MKEVFECPWCGSKIEKTQYPLVQSFLIFFEVGITSDIGGYSTKGYEVLAMCTPCAWKLKEELIKLGIKIQDIDV